MFTRRNALGIVSGSLFAGRAYSAATTRHLYALTAAPRALGDGRFPAVLWSLGSQGGSIRWAREIIPARQGVDFVLCSLDGGVALIGSPKYQGTTITALDFNAPGLPRTARFGGDSSLVIKRHLFWRDGQIHLALCLVDARVRNRAEYEYLSVRLSDLSNSKIPRVTLYRDFANDGTPGIVLDNTDAIGLNHEAASGRILARGAAPRIPTGISVPIPGPIPPGDIQLAAANRQLWVFTWGLVRERIGPSATTPLAIHHRPSGRWWSLEAPGGGCGFRLFGEFVAVQVREILPAGSPAKPISDAEVVPRSTGPSFAVVRESLGVRSPGVLLLYHVPSQRTIRRDTNEPDTEVLWVENERVLYRCDRTLYEARIEGTRLVDQTKLLERDFIADVHWVFYGPASDPPSNPPWRPFDAN